MGKKTEKYMDLPLDLAPMLHAIAHPARIQIIMHLAKYDECQAGGISENLPLAKSTVSEHLNKLKEVGLIYSTAEQNYLLYSLNQEKYERLVDLFSDFKLLVEGSMANQSECACK